MTGLNHARFEEASGSLPPRQTSEVQSIVRERERERENHIEKMDVERRIEASIFVHFDMKTKAAVSAPSRARRARPSRREWSYSNFTFLCVWLCVYGCVCLVVFARSSGTRRIHRRSVCTRIYRQSARVTTPAAPGNLQEKNRLHRPLKTSSRRFIFFVQGSSRDGR